MPASERHGEGSPSAASSRLGADPPLDPLPCREGKATQAPRLATRASLTARAAPVRPRRRRRGRKPALPVTQLQHEPPSRHSRESGNLTSFTTPTVAKKSETPAFAGVTEKSS